MTSPLLQVKQLRIRFSDGVNTTEAVKGIDLTLEKGRTLAVVGESGSGKSVSALALTRLLPPPPACTVEGEVLLNGENLLKASARDLRAVRGRKIAYVFQEPSTSLNPVFTVGFQIAEAIRLHFPEEKKVRDRVIEALARVGIRDADQRYRAYPHELSGGMQQRVMIAMALACQPQILVADEPTTALDVTIQKQILDLLRKLRTEQTMAIMLITHNFGLVAEFADEVAVMFRGEVVERGETAQVLRHPEHPYTRALIDCIPRLGARRHRLTTIDHQSLV
jgi:ABC-type dipeptide/oligopeptide/nickel transport system ATPase component